jgi:hypothetical protein
MSLRDAYRMCLLLVIVNTNSVEKVLALRQKNLWQKRWGYRPRRFVPVGWFANNDQETTAMLL